LRELEEEWDVERAIEANAAVFSLAGLALAVTVDRRWLAFPSLLEGSFCNIPFRGGAHHFRCFVVSASAHHMRSMRSVSP
jgi:hypothetical protein